MTTLAFTLSIHHQHYLEFYGFGHNSWCRLYTSLQTTLQHLPPPPPAPLRRMTELVWIMGNDSSYNTQERHPFITHTRTQVRIHTQTHVSLTHKHADALLPWHLCVHICRHSLYPKAHSKTRIHSTLTPKPAKITYIHTHTMQTQYIFPVNLVSAREHTWQH